MKIYLKSFLAIMFILAVTSTSKCQTMHHGGYFSPTVSIAKINSQTGVITGGKAMWIIGEHFGLGGGYYSLVSNINAVDIGNNESYKLGISYGGLEFTYLFFPTDAISLSANFLTAGGALKKPVQDYNGDFQLWQPGFSFGYKLNEYFSLNITTSYSFIGNLGNYRGLTSESIKGFSYSLSLLLGRYTW